MPGSITDTGTGINLSSNTGATVSFTGTIDASTGANDAFTATSGGIVNVSTGATRTLTTTAGITSPSRLWRISGAGRCRD